MSQSSRKDGSATGAGSGEASPQGGGGLMGRSEDGLVQGWLRGTGPEVTGFRIWPGGDAGGWEVQAQVSGSGDRWMVGTGEKQQICLALGCPVPVGISCPTQGQPRPSVHSAGHGDTWRMAGCPGHRAVPPQAGLRWAGKGAGSYPWPAPPALTWCPASSWVSRASCRWLPCPSCSAAGRGRAGWL